MTDITYHVDEHIVTARLKHFEANEERGEFCSLRISFETSDGIEVSGASLIVDGNESRAKEVLSAIKAAL